MNRKIYVFGINLLNFIFGQVKGFFGPYIFFLPFFFIKKVATYIQLIFQKMVWESNHYEKIRKKS